MHRTSSIRLPAHITFSQTVAFNVVRTSRIRQAKIEFMNKARMCQKKRQIRVELLQFSQHNANRNAVPPKWHPKSQTIKFTISKSARSTGSCNIRKKYLNIPNLDCGFLFINISGLPHKQNYLYIFDWKYNYGFDCIVRSFKAHPPTLLHAVFVSSISLHPGTHMQTHGACQ